MNIALLTKYSRLGASSRLRSLQYLDNLKECGIYVKVNSLFDDIYLERLYKRERRSFYSIVHSYAKRASKMHSLKESDLIWLEKEALPYVPYWLEKSLMPSGVPYVVDYDDAVFHNYDLSSRSVVKHLLSNKIDNVMANAVTVICGNNYLAERAEAAGAKRIEIVPTVVDANRYSTRSRLRAKAYTAPVIGWIGSPSTQRYVLELKQVLTAMHRQHGARLVLVGARPELSSQFDEMPVEVLPWTESSEAEIISNFDIGIMPLPDGPWERGKCGYKLIQYMAAGKPVVASPVGVNVEIVEGWHCGELAGNFTQWNNSLNNLLFNTTLCQAMGQRGRLAVEEYYSLNIQAPRLAEILKDAI